MKAISCNFIGLLRRPLFRLLISPAALMLPCMLGERTLRAEIPEPPTLFYGQVVNRTSGQVFVLTNGTLVWKIAPVGGGNQVVLTTALGAQASGMLSYQLKVPHHALAPGATVPAGAVPLTQAGVDYQHVEITVDGLPARILGDTGDPLHLAQANRATACRLDLEVFNPLADSDGDGIPDWWEDLYGLNKYFAGDANLDRDGDGASNLREFRDGSDPTAANRSPTVVTSRITALEGGTVGIRLQVLDSDSVPQNLQYTLLTLPAGGALALRDGDSGSDRLLAASDRFTQADVNAGRLIFRQQDTAAEPRSMVLTVQDENPDHAASTGTVAIAVSRPAATEPGKVALWLDANQAAAAGGQTWLDNSGNHFDAHAPAPSMPAYATDSAGGNRSLCLAGGGYWDLELTDEVSAFPPGDRTVFAAFKAAGCGRQQLLGTTRFELGLTALDDAIRPGQLRYATESAALYSPRPVQGQWLLATVCEQSTQTQLELNGLWSAGPNSRNESTALASKSAVGGKAVGQYNPVTQSWQFQPTELLSGEVGEILVFKRALSAAERRRINYHLLSKWFGYILWDASAEARSVTITVPSAGLSAAEYANYVATHGPDRCNILLGGAGADDLRGGMEADFLVGGPGNNRLTGGGGRDVFVIGADEGNDTIVDFRVAEGDTIDLSDLLTGSSRNLADYVQLSTVGTNSWLRVNSAGTGSVFTNLEITLPSTVLRQSDLEYLWANGNVVARGIGFEGRTWINVAATKAASEEGPAAGEFTLTRSGSSDAGLTINLSVGGSAANGVDYSYISPVATFAPGQSTLKIAVQPYTDSLLEVPEVVELTVLAGSGYTVGTEARAQLTIADLPERISIEAVEPFACRSGPVPGYFLLSRSGVLDRSTVVRLSLGGTAANAVDFQYVPSFVMLSPGQSSALIPITPVVTQPPLTGAKSVELRVLSDPNSIYLLGSHSSARVWLIEETMTLGLWRTRYLAGATTDLVLLAGQDPDQDGLVNLVEYSLGLNPGQRDDARSLLPRARIREGYLAVEFKKRVAARDLQYLVEVSTDLVNWQSGSAYVEEVAVPEFSSQPEMVCFKDRTPCSAASHRYIRVRLNFQP